MLIGAKVPNSGPLPAERGIGAMAAELERAGFESLWVSDHVVMPGVIASRYPFAADGKATWPPDTPYIDAMIALTAISAATSLVRFGPAVLVLPLRHPVVLAKQVASIDVLSGGRLELGIGAGWLAEEFAALGVPFAGRGERLTESIEILRAIWTGEPAPFAGRHYTVPGGLHSGPVPPHRIPLLIGGHSDAARRRAAVSGDGWLAQQSAVELDPGRLAADITAMREAAAAAGRDPDALRAVLRIVDSAQRPEQVAAALPALAGAGVTEIIVDTDWSQPGSAAAVCARLMAAASRAPQGRSAHRI
jgi:probable F420-dependent oxidoreductase